MGGGSYFERIGEHAFRPTAHAGGAWNPGELHFSPLGGLLVHAIERHAADRSGPPLIISRISFDILGFLADDVCEVVVETIRPGRTIELVEATLSIGGRVVTRARAWLLASIDTSVVAGGEDQPLPSPEGLPSRDLTAEWVGGYIASIDVRMVASPHPGRGTAWLTSEVELVAGEQAGALASYVMLVDTANGIATRESPTAWMFPNVDLTIHLHRQPGGRWVGLDTTVVFGATGQGITSTVLHDIAGPVGRAHQQLTVRPMPSA
ncbi:MAG: thioesterase family protein [Pseudolysinimonas sp.]